MAKDDKKSAEKPKKLSKKWDAYEVSDEGAKKKLRSCPKCGDGVFLAKHSDRQTCGKCGYTEFAKKEEKAD